MDPFNLPPVAAILELAYSGLLGLSHLLTPLAGVTASALAIVLVTILVRFILIPVGVSQTKAQWTQRRLAPRLGEIRRRYAKKPELLQKKTMELYKEEGASPFAGMLPALAQAPFVSIVYALFIRAEVDGHGNALLTDTLAGVPLGTGLFGVTAWQGFVVFGVILLVSAVTAWFSRRSMLALQLPDQPNAGLTRAMSWLSFVPVIIAAFVPLAAALYVVVSSLWALGERAVLRKIYWR